MGSFGCVTRHPSPLFKTTFIRFPFPPAFKNTCRVVFNISQGSIFLWQRVRQGGSNWASRNRAGSSHDREKDPIPPTRQPWAQGPHSPHHQSRRLSSRSVSGAAVGYGPCVPLLFSRCLRDGVAAVIGIDDGVFGFVRWRIRLCGHGCRSGRKQRRDHAGSLQPGLQPGVLGRRTDLRAARTADAHVRRIAVRTSSFRT